MYHLVEHYKLYSLRIDLFIYLFCIRVVTSCNNGLMCFVWPSEQTVITAVYNINWNAFHTRDKVCLNL